MNKPKYIRTSNNCIIVFSGAMNHSDFKHLNPVSAGFISIGVDKDGNPDCECYGESSSLDMKADEKDSMRAKLQIFGNMY
jgi:hypothetical protein